MLPGGLAIAGFIAQAQGSSPTTLSVSLIISLRRTGWYPPTKTNRKNPSMLSRAKHLSSSLRLGRLEIGGDQSELVKGA
jgi:hypothetical protein